MKTKSLCSVLLILQLLTLTVHQSCSATYQYFNPNSNTCEPCPTSCLSCFDEVSCTACIEQYYLDNNQCKPCQFGCAVCTDADTCTTCVDGLYINADGDCVPCGVGVRSCSIAVVESCKDGYFMLGSICAGCFDHCNVCQDFVTCSLCQTGYYVGPTSTTCLPCSPNCQVCMNDSICTSCSQGYVLDVGACVAPNCSSISPFCAKCTNGVCQECTFGKYLNSNGLCSQGGSLLCNSATGPYHTNCQTSLYNCPAYAQAQTDSIQNTQLPICLPLHASQNTEYIYKKYPSTCTILSPSACSTPSTQRLTFTTMKSYYSLKYHISVKVYNVTTQDFVVSYVDGLGNVLDFRVGGVEVGVEMGLGDVDAQCYNCKYGVAILTGQLSISGGSNATTLQIKSLASFFEVTQLIIQAGICKVSRCSACTTAIDCVQCNYPYFLQLISCIEQCDPGFYKYGRTCVLACPADSYPIQSSYQCQACVSPCLTCSTQTDCLSCVDGYFLDGTACVTKCSKSSLFTNLTSKACETCPNPCTECTVTTTNTSNSTNTSLNWTVSCSGCGVGYLLQAGNCTFICPSGTFANYINNKTQCSSCVTGCSECSIAENICFSCVSAYLLDGSVCHLNYICPLGYFVDSVKNSCDKCHYPCLTCSGISTNCTSCLKGAFYNYTCPLQCPSGMYIKYSQNVQVCTACTSPCLQCLSPVICLSCISGTFLQNSQCLPNCSDLTYYPQPSNSTCMPCVPPCLQCLSPTQCLSCTTGYVDLSTHTCTLVCNATSYPDTDFVCRLCAYPCIRCYSASTCSMCALPSVLYNQTCITVSQCSSLNRYTHYKLNYTDPLLSNQSAECSQCTYPCSSCLNSPIVCKSCAAGYKFVSDLAICVQECPQSYYSAINPANNNTECYRCDSNCLGCFGLSTNCTLCGTSMYLFTNRTCMLLCPTGYYGSNQEQLCKPCQLPCQDCYNAYLCKSCATGIYYNKACVSSCPSGSIHNLTDNTCQQCTNNCLSCSILTSNCTQCPTNGFYYYQHQCLATCPTLYYSDDLSHNCQACIQPCLECRTSTQCVSCRAGYYLILGKNRCSTVCPQGYFADGNASACLQCNTTICRTCSISANNCSQCSSGYYYNSASQQCVQTCPAGTYADEFYLQCQQCQFPCSICNTTSCLLCSSSYQLFNGNCYSECPLGYFSNNSTCAQCAVTCQVCTSSITCVKCVGGYYVNSVSTCVVQCQIGYYKGYDALTSYAICKKCPAQCTSCLQIYNCTQCIAGYYSFNGLCVDQCPALYYPSTTSSCQACPKFCNKCNNATSCLQCVNSYKYNNLCYSSCPATTYTYNQQQCIDCTFPCLECTSTFSCVTCVAGYFYFQNYCMEKCPTDVWKYPETSSCAGDCPYNKYSKEMECYRTGCGGMLVHLNGYCLEQCPSGYYVDQNQNCVQCTGQTICSNIMTGQLQILRSYNLRACIYFSQLITPESVSSTQISTKFYNKNTGELITYSPSSITIDDNMIMIEFGYTAMLLHVLEVKIPYVVSRETKQSVSYNLFKANVDVYNDYQYGDVQAAGRLLAGASFNVLYSPSPVLNVLAIVIVGGAFLCVIVNIVAKGTHYRQLLDFLQFVAATMYLQIQYPPILQQYLKNLRISLFSFLPQLTQTKPYKFSPPKLIQYHKDISMLRTQGILFIIFMSMLFIFGILILINKLKPEVLRPVIRRIKYRNVCDLFSIVSLPLLLFCFRFTRVGVMDVVCQVTVLLLVVGFVIYMSYVLMTVKNLQEIAGLAGQLQATQNPLGHMYTPFSFIRKIIFSLVLCIQPSKPISTLSLLLIFTILIMVCLFFYQPFQNQTTDYICISMEIALILYVVIVMIFGLNGLTGTAGHYMGIIGAGITVLAGSVGLGWLGFLTVGAVAKWRKETQTTNDHGLQQNLNSQANANKQSGMDPNSAMKISIKDPKQSEQNAQSHKDDQQPSATHLIHPKNQRRSRFSKNSQQFEVDIGDSEVGDQFRHWNNSQSDKVSEEDGNNQAPRYLLKMEKNQEQQQQQQ